MRHLSFFASITIVACAAIAPAQICTLEIEDTVPAPGSLSTTVIVGTTAYVAAGSAGIVTVDISDATNMAVAAYDDTEGTANDLALEYFSDTLVVADGSAGVGTYEITASGLLHHGTTAVGGTAISVSGISDQFYVGTAEGSLVTVAIDSNNVPQVQGSLALGGPVRGLFEKSNRVYCALGTANEIAVVNVSDPSSPTLLTTIPLSGEVHAIARSSSRVLVGVESEGLLSFTISGDTLLPEGSLPLDSAPHRIFAWDDRIYMASPASGVVEADSSLAGGILQIAELALPGADGLALLGDHLFVARGTSGFSAVDISACAAGQGTPTTSFIPAAARAEGSANSFWVTDVAIANFTTGIATFNIAYLVKDEDNSNPLNTTMAIGAGQQMLLADVFNSVFGLQSANGGLRIVTSDGDVKITSRTYNTAGLEGTYGQFIPALTADAAVEPGVVGVLLQLQENDAFRTNIGAVNLGSSAVQLSVKLYDDSGTLVGTLAGEGFHLEPYEMTQVGRAFAVAGAGQVDSGYAMVEVVGDAGKALAYASVVDQGSNDPIYIPTQALLAGFE